MAATIQIPIPESLARFYDSASAEDKRKAQWLIELVLRDLFQNPNESLTDVIQDISQRAAERGMTQAVLDDLCP